MLYIQVSGCSWTAKPGNVNGVCSLFECMHVLAIGASEDPPGKAVVGLEVQSVTYLYYYSLPKEVDIVLALKRKGNDF